MNALALAVLPPAWWTVPLAWVVSQAMGTTCNFVMLRTVVFRDRTPTTSPDADGP